MICVSVRFGECACVSLVIASIYYDIVYYEIIQHIDELIVCSSCT